MLLSSMSFVSRTHPGAAADPDSAGGASFPEPGTRLLPGSRVMAVFT